MSQTASPTEAVSPDGGGPLTLVGMPGHVTVTSFPGPDHNRLLPVIS